MATSHDSFMQQALALAPRGGTFVSPNPTVGAVVVQSGNIVGRGWHQKFGGPHAEIFALSEAGPAARGATLYCTLEPCNHTGKTPPCTKAIVEAGIKTVVFGAADPNPVAAGGTAALRAAGIEVITGVLEADCRAVNAPFLKTVETGLPFISLKWAMSADGKIAAAGGDSKWITSPQARAAAHRLRAQHDAVLIGIGTLLADQARLTCRDVPAPIRQPRRVVLDSSARTPLDAPLWSEQDGGTVTLICADNAPTERVVKLKDRGAEILSVKSSGGKIVLSDALKALAKLGVLSVLVEGGSSVLGSFVDSRLADRAYIFIAPRIIGGEKGVSAVGGQGVSKVADSLNFRSTRMAQIGPDFVISGSISLCDWSGGWLVEQTC